MSLIQDVRSITPALSTPELLRFLIEERFPGKTVVTASLRARSIVVLKLVADIDPGCPVVFCHPGNIFPESLAYRARIVEQLGLTNVTTSSGHEVETLPGDHDHCERMWAEDKDGGMRVFEIVHLNETLAPYDCWISAVYHVARPPGLRQRVDIYGRLIGVDPLLHWTQDEVRAFMREHELASHPRAARRKPAPPKEQVPLPPSYNY